LWSSVRLVFTDIITTLLLTCNSQQGLEAWKARGNNLPFAFSLHSHIGIAGRESFMPVIFHMLPSSKYSWSDFSFPMLTCAEKWVKFGEGNKIITIFMTLENTCFPRCYSHENKTLLNIKKKKSLLFL